MRFALSDEQIEFRDAVRALLADTCGPDAVRAAWSDAELESRWLDGYTFSLSGPIYAGTNEIQRNIIAERILGLPREPKGAGR